MKVRLPLLILIFAFQTAGAQAPDPDFNDKIAFSEGRSHQKTAAFYESEGNADYDLIYQQLNFTVDPAVRYITGSVYSSVKFLSDKVSEIQFDLVNVMTVDSVKLNQKLSPFSHSENKVRINLPMQMDKNGIGSIEVFYHGVPPETGFGSFTINKHENAPILWTLSEPYGARDWWPCKQSLSDKVDSLDIFITCPKTYKAASNGKLISDQVSGEKRTAHWQHRYPIASYLVGIAVTNYETYSDFLDLPDGNKIEILNYIYPEYLETAKSKSVEIRNIMQFYNEQFIPYPFAREKYGHAQFGWGGGMEHQTMSFMTDLEYELVAHEMAHQWFGDYITLASWHDIWLNEGFATYLTGLTYENSREGGYWAKWKSQQVAKVTSKPDGSVYVADTTNIWRIFDGRLTYTKGSMLLHMLRWEIGDERFFQGLKNYLTDPAIAHEFATQQEFVTTMEMAADTSLTEFFKDWYYGEGFPNYHLVYYPDAVNPEIQKLRISQTPSHSSVDFFDMHIPIRVWINGESRDLRLYNTMQNQEFPISDQPFDSLQFDPDQWLIARTDQISNVPGISKPKQIQIIPESDQKSIRVILPEFSGTESLKIMDMNGRLLLLRRIISRDSQIETRNLKPGIYLIEVESKSRKRTEKIFVR